MKNKFIDYLKLIVVALILELVLFNITSYRNIFGKYKKIEYLKNNIKYIGTNREDKAVYEIKDINNQICSIKILLNESKINNCNYFIAYSDETSKEYLSLPEKTYFQSIDRSKIIATYLSGNVNGIRIYIDNQVNENNLLEKIIINDKIPINFNFMRFFIVLSILCLVKLSKSSDFINKNYSIKNFKQEIVLIGVLMFFICITGYINLNCTSSASDNMYNKGIVDSITHGKLYLLVDPSKKFMELDDPYDRFSRNSLTRDEDYIWDSAYYNGHQYVYFGILPVILTFLPFFLITGTYLKTEYVVFIFSILVLILLKEILTKLITIFFKDIPFKIVILSLIILLSGSLIIYLNGIPRFYEVAIVSGLYFVLQGIWFILKAMENERVSYKFLFCSCLFFALSVACRPIDLIASVIILPILVKQFIAEIKELKANKEICSVNNDKSKIKRNNKANLIKFILSVITPYLFVGVCLMYYNYIRFDNVFEFGAKYQLTVNNMEKLGSRIFTIPAGIICNLFSIPRIIPNFPFIVNHNNIINFNGYYYVENMIGGLFILSPICFLNLYVFKLKNKIKNKELIVFIAILEITAFIITILSIMMAGSNPRYLVDYAWMFIISSILIFISIYEFLKTNEAKKIMIKIFTIIACYTLIINIFSGIVSEDSFFKKYSIEEYNKLKYTICFWE